MKARSLLVVALLFVSMGRGVSGQSDSPMHRAEQNLDAIRIQPYSRESYPEPRIPKSTQESSRVRLSRDWVDYSDGMYVAFDEKPPRIGGPIGLKTLPPQLYRIVTDKKNVRKLVGNGPDVVVEDQITPIPFDETIQILSDQISDNPKEPSLYLARGVIAWQARQFGQATADLDDAIRLRPKGALAYYFRGLVSYDLGVMNNAGNQENPNAHVRADEYLRAYSDLSEALRLDRIQCDADFKLDSFTRPNAYLIRGRTCLRPTYYSLAIEDFTTSLRLDPNNISIYKDRGMAYASLNKPAAIADFQRGLDVISDEKDDRPDEKDDRPVKKDDRPEWLLQLADTYNGLGNRREAIIAYGEVIKHASLEQVTKARLSRGGAFESSSPDPNYDAALSDYKAVIDSTSTYKSLKRLAYAGAARIHSQRREFRLAIEDCSGYLKVDVVLKDDSFANEVFSARGDFRTQVANDILLRYPPARRILESDHNEADRLLVDALEDYKQAIALDSSYVNAFLGRANVYTSQKNYTGAIEDLNAALQILSKSTDATSQQSKVDATSLRVKAVAAKFAVDAKLEAAKKKPVDNRLTDAQTIAAIEETAARIEEARARSEAAKANSERAKLDASKSIQSRANPEPALSKAGTQATLEETTVRIEEARAKAEKARLEAARSFNARQAGK